MPDKLFYRESIVDLLEDIASEQPSTSESERICGWFDDLYLPGFNPQHYTSEGWNRGIREFESCFASAELEALARFHAFYDQWLKANQRNWTPVREQAAATLKVFK
jgi:hypothetical protein